MRIGALVVIVWLIIGAAAAAQRGYFSGDGDTSCAETSTIAATIVAGPLNYLGVNPKIEKCADVNVPQPSK